MCSPRPRMTTGRLPRKSGTSDPSCAASAFSVSASKGLPQSVFKIFNAVAAFELPPPSPAPCGTFFSSFQAIGGHAGTRLRKACAARMTRLEASVGTPGIVQASESASAGVAESVSPSEIGATSETRA